MTTPLRRAILHLGLAAGAAFMLAPYVIMVRTAFTAEDRVLSGGTGLQDVTVENFVTAWRAADWIGYYRTGLIVTAGIFLLQVATALPAGYALARLSFRGRNAVLWLVLVCIIIPINVTAIPLYVMLSRVGLTDSIPGLILPFSTSAFGIYLFRQFCLSIPQSIFDAARLDGVGPVAMVWRVVFPNVRPAIVGFGILSVVSHWNDLFWPSVILRTADNATVPYGITLFASQETGTQYGPLNAAAVLAVGPLFVCYLLAQRQFVRGFTLSASTD